MESATNISFTAPSNGTLTLVFGGTTAAGGKSVKGTDCDLLHLVKEKADAEKKPRLYVSCGTADFLYGQHQKFIPLLKKHGWDVTHYEEPDAVHEWGFWDREIRKFIAFIFEA